MSGLPAASEWLDRKQKQEIVKKLFKTPEAFVFGVLCMQLLLSGMKIAILCNIDYLLMFGWMED